MITTDYLNSWPIVLELKIGDFYELGKLLVIANLSDLCGTGAKPLCFLSSIMLKRNS